MKIKTLALALAASAAIAGAADAATRTFTISNGTFTDGGTFGGSFDFNETAYIISNVNIFTRGGIFSDYVYSDRDVDYFGQTELVLDSNNLRYFSITFSPGLSGEANSKFSSSIKGYELNSDRDDREVKSGILTVAAVPEPATWAMMLVGFGMIGATARYRRRLNRIIYA